MFLVLYGFRVVAFLKCFGVVHRQACPAAISTKLIGFDVRKPLFVGTGEFITPLLHWLCMELPDDQGHDGCGEESRWYPDGILTLSFRHQNSGGT